MTFTCIFPKALVRRQIYRYKQSPGEHLNVIAVTGNLLKPVYAAAFSASKFQINEAEELYLVFEGKNNLFFPVMVIFRR